MLYEFHKTQNAKRPGAVHATYVVYGVKKSCLSASQTEDGDVDMDGTPEAEPSEERIPTFTLALIPEEKLRGGPTPDHACHVLQPQPS